MTKGSINIDLGAKGKHVLTYTLEHTGKGYVSFLADVPTLGFKEYQIKPSKEVDKYLLKLTDAFDNYEELLNIRNHIPLVMPDKITFDIDKLGIELGKPSIARFIKPKASVNIIEVRKTIEELELALEVEKTRSAFFVAQF